MIVYKFGGASVKSSDGIKNISKIVSLVKEDLFIVVSAMGKTTNAMEEVLDFFMKADKESALKKMEEVEKYHYEIIGELFENKTIGENAVKPLFDELKDLITTGVGTDYDRWYDRLVSYGEVISTKIVSEFLLTQGVHNSWLDMRQLLVTDSNFREANVHMIESEKRLRAAVDFKQSKVFIGQGFIGTNMQGAPTTLGREGSDYTAAVVGNLLNAESVSIWKDVPGILNADPRIFPDTVLIPELTYMDAVELAYSGAQIIHPKTIKPLENKSIPLYVRPFGNPSEAGSVIKSSTSKPIDIPVLILKKNQMLVTLRPLDFSFILEESLTWIFTVVEKYRLKVGLIQSSAISISICVDNNRYLQRALDEFANDYKVSYNTDLELLTIRGTNPEIIEQTTHGREILVQQNTRRIARILMREK
ncbi:MAG TPA: aspartate kinase [Paludibacteraceae bacterium]|mgnify:CR=1 FL=1|nr:aspartate kinase [Paludibacteraceae bacterium]HPT42462.1 aspartate kinase [Paludibacteraceae bacterium]